MQSTVKERLIKYLKNQGISQKSFEQEVSLSNGYVNNIRKSIQPDKIERISIRYPNLNTGWLLTGEGEMIKQTSVSSPPENYDTNYKEKYINAGAENERFYGYR